jgi:hypothetical protein
MKSNIWSGEANNCDLCNKKIDNCFIDGKTKMGPWGIMCLECYLNKGIGLGLGLGQLYIKNNNKFINVSLKIK